MIMVWEWSRGGSFVRASRLPLVDCELARILIWAPQIEKKFRKDRRKYDCKRLERKARKETQRVKRSHLILSSSTAERYSWLHIFRDLTSWPYLTWVTWRPRSETCYFWREWARRGGGRTCHPFFVLVVTNQLLWDLRDVKTMFPELNVWKRWKSSLEERGEENKG